MLVASFSSIKPIAYNIWIGVVLQGHENHVYPAG